MSPEKIKANCRVQYEHLVDIAMRLIIPDTYRYRLKSYKSYILAKYKVNIDPVYQLYIYLAKSAHASTLKIMSQDLKISRTRQSVIFRGVKKIIFLIHVHLLTGHHVKFSDRYLHHLMKNAPNVSLHENNKMRPNTAFHNGWNGS